MPLAVLTRKANGVNMLTKVRFGFMHLRHCCPILRWTVFIAVILALVGSPQTRRSEAQSHPESSSPAQPASKTAESAATDNQPEEPEQAVGLQPAPGNVEIDGQTILTVYQSVGSFTATDRAAKISERILAAAKRGADPKTVALTVRPVWTEISVEGNLLLAVTDEDAKNAAKPRAQLATEDAEIIRQVLLKYRQEHNWRAVFRGIIYSLIATLLLLPIAFVVRKFHLFIRGRLERWLEKH